MFLRTDTLLRLNTISDDIPMNTKAAATSPKFAAASISPSPQRPSGILTPRLLTFPSGEAAAVSFSHHTGVHEEKG